MADILTVPETAGATSDARCAVCGAEAGHQLSLLVHHAGNQYRVFTCRNCGTRFYDPLPDPDYSSHTDNAIDRRIHIEHEANISFMLERIAPAVLSRPSGSFVDIGCGYGFAVDMVRHLFGWTAYGVEPSAYGRYGSDALGFPLVNRMLTWEDPFDGRKFDIIHSSEVIEHTHDPARFVDLILHYLAPDGCVVLTTPAAEALADPRCSVPRRLALLSPGIHTYLFTAASLEQLLRARGFGDVNVASRDGTLTAYASQQRLQLKPVDNLNSLLWQYYETSLRRVSPDSTTGRGFGLRYFTSLVVHGKYEDAQRVWDWMSLQLPDKPPEVRSREEFLAVLPVAACEIAYVRATLVFHDRNRPEKIAARFGLKLGIPRLKEAARLFGLAFALAQLKLDIAPAISTSEAVLFWQARYHEAFALYGAGEHTRAAEIAREMLDPSSYPKYRPMVLNMDEELIRRTKELIPPG